jgi:hypothetical protein
MNSIVLVLMLVLVLDIFRYLPSGNFDTTFGTNGIVTNSVPAGTGGLEGVVIQPADGKIVTVGTANNLAELTVSRYLARLDRKKYRSQESERRARTPVPRSVSRN